MAIETQFIQGESFTIADGDTSLLRTRTANQERNGVLLDGQTDNGVSGANPGLPDYDIYGLRPGHTGDGYLDINGSDTGAQAEVDFSVPAGTYEIHLRLANGSGDARPITIDVDGTRQTISDTRTGDFAVWQTFVVEVTVTGDGPHTLTIEQDGSAGAPNVDAIAIADVGTPVSFLPQVSVQGEDGTITGTGTRALTQTNAEDEGTSGNNNDAFNLRPDYSGSGYLDFGSSNNGSESVAYTIDAPTSGTFDLHIRYASSGTRNATLTDGIGTETQVSFPTTGATGDEAFNNWSVVTVPVVLEAGTNTLDLALNNGNGPNVDALVITETGGTPDFGPRFTTEGAFVIDEGETAVGSVAATDVDPDTTDDDDALDPVSYSIAGGADSGAFTIDGSSGALSLNEAADFETQNSYSVDVAATDSGGNVVEQSVTVGVNDLVETPVVGAALLTVNAGSTNVDASTFTSGTIALSNTGDKAITSVVIDLSNALFTNANSAMVFDPAGGAGDATAKDFENNGGTGGYTVTPSLSGGNDTDGYTTLTLSFDSFAAGDTLDFSIDIDPTSIQGASGSGEAGSVSGLELTGSTVAVTYDDASTASSTLFGDGSIAGAVATISDAEPVAPTLSLGGGSGEVEVTGETQTVTVGGPANATVTVLIAEGGLGNGVAAQTLFDTNTATGVTYQSVTLDGSGQGSFDVTIAEGTPLYMAAAVQGDEAGAFGAVSGSLSLARGADAPQVPSDFNLALQTEDFAVITDAGDENMLHRVRDEPETAEGGTGKDAYGLWGNYEGRGYTDFGEDAGDQFSITVDVPVAGSYDLHTRYGNGSGQVPNRLIDITVGDGTPQQVDFNRVGAANWDEWQVKTITVELAEGENTLTYAISDAQDPKTGPNVDAIALTAQGGTPDFTAPNYDPAITSAPVLTVAEGDTAVGTVTAFDNDEDTVSFALTDNGADDGLFSIDASTGALSFTAAPDFETPGSAAGTNTYSLEVEVSDGQGGSSVQALTVEVTDVDDTPVNTAPTATDGTASTDEDAVDFAIDIADLIADAEDGEPTITEATSANGTVTISGTELLFTPTPDFNGDAVIAYTVEDSEGLPASGEVSVTVAPVNDAPTITGTLADVTVTDAEGTSIDLSGLSLADIDTDPADLTLGVRLANGDPAPAGVTVTDTTLTIPTGLTAGELDLEVFVSDGDLASVAVVPLTLTVEAAGPFAPITIQAEDGVITLAQPEDAQSTQVRDAENPETNGNRPDFTGTGYLDYGNDAGDTASYTFIVPAGGDYDLNVRYATNTDRPLDLSVNGGAATELPFVSTDPDGGGAAEGFDNWEFQTTTISLQTGSNTISFAIPAGTNTGPNLDRIEITEAGTGPIPLEDLSADEDGNLAAAPVEATVPVDDLAAVEVRLTGVDADIVAYEVSTDGGATFVPATPVADGADQVLTVDLTGTAAGTTVDVQVRLTDDADNEITTTASVDVEEEVVQPFNLVVQLENRDGTITIDDDTLGTGEGDPLATQFRDLDNIEGVQPGRDDGLWNGYTGTGYMDMGGNVGDAFEFDVDVPDAGTYSFTFRYVNAGGNGADRPMILSVDGTEAATIPFVSTGSGATGWTNWTDVTVEVDLAAGPNTIRMENTIANGPNLDRVTVASIGPVIDDSADEDGNLDVSAAASVAVADSDMVDFTLTGVDADIVTYEVSIDGGDFTEVTPVGGVVSLDLSTFGAGTSVDVVFRLTDDDANTVEQTASVAIVADPVEAFEVTIQLEERVSDVPGEDNSPANIVIDDDTAGGGDNDPNLTQIRDPLNTEGATPERGPDGLWDNFNGTGYLDMGQNAGDAFSFEIVAPSAGTYTVEFRYANGGAADRPMELIVDGETVRLAFPSTTDWDNWQVATAEVELEAGTNTLRLEIPSDVATFTGPNLDQVTVSREGDVVPPPESEPGPRDTIKINFQDGETPKVDGYLAGNFDGFADQGNGQTYGWITEDSALDADGTANTPIVAGDYPGIAINERSGAGIDPRLLGYAHFDLGGYPERTAWEIELENGFYEVTVSVGDTAGANDSDNRLFIEGELATAWSATDEFKSQLITTTANVQDGHLTLSAQGGTITEMQYLEIRDLPDLTPGDGNGADVDYAQLINPVTLPGEIDLQFGDGLRPEGVDPTANFAFDVLVAGNRGGVLETSLNSDTVKLFETLTGEEVNISLNTTGGFDAVVFNPETELKEFTSYTIVVDGLLDRGSNDDPDSAPREFQKYSTSFVTGEAPEVVDREVAFNDILMATEGAFASLTFSPDGSQLYVSTLSGSLIRWDLDPATGEIVASSRQQLDLPELNAEAIIGLTFDPTNDNRLWVTANDAGLSGATDFTGEIYTVDIDEGSAFTASANLVVTGLPRSARDHLSNSLAFRENPDADQPDQPSHLLYLIQGSNSAMGAPDPAWANRAERALSAAVVEIDPRIADQATPLDVQTEQDWTAGNNPPTSLDPLNDPANPNTYQFTADGEAFVDGFYNPFAEDAPVTVFSNGQRNAYDLVWHSNGFLYVPTNGSAGGARAPDDPDTPEFEGITNIPTRNDYLFAVEEGGYYGHPNPILGNFILNGGNPTSGNDPAEVSTYDVGTLADPNYRGFAFDFGRNISPNGAAEYTSNVFGANLQGAVIVTQYSSPDNLIALLPGPDGNIISSQVIRRPDNSVIEEYTDPLDVIVNPETGQMYMVTFNRGNGSSELVLLNPAPGGEVADTTADEGNDLALTVIDASDPAAVVFAVTGLDDDIVTVSVSFNGTASEVVTLNAQNQFTFDLSDETVTVDATLTVDDDAGNSASSPTISFTPGETPEPQGFYDGRDFTNLDPGSTVIRLLEDSSTHEDPDSGNDGNDDGLNDGFDGNSYVDFGGGAGDKVSLDLTVAVAGIYDVVLRMANGSTNARPIDIKVGDQVVSIANTQTGDFTTWQDFPIQLSLQAGANTIVVEQTAGAGGPNIDSATVTLNTPTGVPNDGTETVGGVDFLVYEAENAELGGAVIDDDPRNQRGGEFVDYDGTTDQTVTFTISVPENGTYQVDLLYALAGSKDARPMTVTVNGTDAGELPFPPNSDEGETIWTPQTATLSLAAGENTIAFTAPLANGPNIDYLRVSTDPVELFDATYAAIDGSGRIELEATDGTARPVDADTAEFYFTVAADGAYVFDLAANPGASDGGGITVSLSADGGLPVVIDENGFPGAGEAGEVSAFANLLAGVEYKLTVQSDAPGAGDIDYLDVSPAPGNENADIEVQSLDPTFYDNRLHFSWVENSDGRDFKESAQVEITNTGSEPLEIFEVSISEFYSVVDPVGLEGTSIAAGDSIVVTVEFDGSTDGTDGFTARSNNVSGVYEGALTLRTNDADSPISTVDLAAFWQTAQEGGNEPNVNEVWEIFGFGNEIANLPFGGGGQNSVLNFDDFYIAAPGQEDIEVLSPYWRLADGVTNARATMIAAYNGGSSAGLGIHNPGDKGQDVGLTSYNSFNGGQGQTILPLNGGNFGTTLFDNGTIPDGWNGNEVFGIEMASLSTDPTLNGSGNGTPSQADLDAAYGVGTYTVSGSGNSTVITDADGNEISDGYTVRMFQALDGDGVAIENVFLGIMDYTGINYDYNDNMFIFEGITPVGDGGALSINGLDAAAADDRLVFTNIDNPNNSGGIGGQEFRNVAEVTLTNSGIGDLDITGFILGGVDSSDFQVTGTTGTLASGASTTVTVEFVGSDSADNGAAELKNATLTVQNDGFSGDQEIALAGLAQFQSEGGEEPSVAQIVEAFGYSTDVAQAQLNNGGLVETVGDEVLLPYVKRLDASQPIEVIQIAAFLQQTDVARLNIHGLESSATTELFAQDDQQGQTVSPEGLVSGSGSSGSVASATIERDDPFGLYIAVDGKQTFVSWSDPEANRLDPNIGGVNGGVVESDEGHLIRFFEAKDAAGNVIEGTYIGIQDYPGAGNYDYNDHMFVIKNVQAHALTADDDADGDGILDALQNDADNDGTVDFFDGDTTPPSAQAPFGGIAPIVDGTLTIGADTFDTGGQGVAWNDNAGKDGGTGGRPDSDVELIGSDIAYVNSGEWVEYTIDVAQGGTYDISAIAKAPTAAATITVSLAGGPDLATITLPDANAPDNDGFGGTAFGPTGTEQIALEAGEQTLRLTFGGTVADNGYVLDLRSFTLVQQEDDGSNQAPEITSADSFEFVEGATDPVFTPTATDPDSDPVTFTLDDGDANLFDIDVDSGAVSFVDSPVFADGGDNVLEFTLTASDGTLVDEQSITVEVLKDTDGDLVPDNADNAIEVANPDQRDTDSDNYGNVIDADFTNDGQINLADLNVFANAFGATGLVDGVDPEADADFNGDGNVNLADLGQFADLFGEPLGPSFIDGIV